MSVFRAVTRILTRTLHTTKYAPRTRSRFLKVASIGTATVAAGCACVYYQTLVACAKEEKAGIPRFVLYQYSNCPFCSKVRAYLHYSGEEFQIVEVNPITKEETKSVTDYKKVPMLVADGIALKESSIITSILHTHFTTGKPISEVVDLYPAVATVPEDNNRANKELVTYPNKYKIMGFLHQEQEVMQRVVKSRKWVDDHFVHLISPNVYRTWREALSAFDYFTASGNFTDFQKVYIRYIGAGVMYVIGRRLKRRHNLSTDVRSDLYSGINHWLRGLEGKKFHGGDEPDLADIEMWGMCSAFHGMQCWQDACEVTKIERWYNRMEGYLKKKSAIGLKSANPTILLEEGVVQEVVS